MNKSKSKNTSLIVFSILIYIGILAVVGMFQIFIFDTDISKVSTSEWWIEQGITSLMYFSAYLATAILRYSVSELNEPQYITLEASITKHRPRLIGNAFRNYIERLDFINKKDTWKNKIQTKLANHVKKITKKQAIQIANLEENKWSFWTRRYVKRERLLKEYMTEEWINKNLRWRPLKYPEITVSEVVNGTLRMKSKGSMLERNHLGKQLFKKLIFVFGSIVASVIWAILIFQEVLNPLDVIAQIIFTLILLLVNIITGYFAAGVAHKGRIIATTERLGIIVDFLKVPAIEEESKEN